MSIAFLNGQFMPLASASISPLDRGFLFGDGIYEVIPTYSGKAVGMKGHLSRLCDGLKAIQIDNSYSNSEWETLFIELLEKNSGVHSSENVGIYLHVSRGADTKRFHGFPEGVKPTVFAFTFEISPPQPNSKDEAKPLTAFLEEDKRWRRCHIKSTALLGNVLHFQAGRASGNHETILHNAKGEVTEASSCNVFMVKNGVIYTPPLSNELLPGITRSIAIASFEKAGLSFEERAFTVEEMFDADEVWLTSSSKEIAPVIEVEGRTIGDGTIGPMWELAIAAYHEHKFNA